jgi:integral membrane protein
MIHSIRAFRWVAFSEGISFLILLFVAMPLKYFYNQPQFVKFFGMVHGVLFVAFIALAVVVMSSCSKKISWLLRALLLSVIPFGTFILEKELKQMDR